MCDTRGAGAQVVSAGRNSRMLRYREIEQPRQLVRWLRREMRTMGFYARFVLPRLIDLVMRDKEAARLRAAWIPRASGEVLELGAGSGLNFPFYSRDVRRVFALDPSRELQRMARANAAGLRLNVEFVEQSADEPLQLDAESIDTVVTTWSLCSIPIVTRALDHVRRVLKPQGRLIFVEHGRAPDGGVIAWQNRITPLWRRVAGGCHLNRKIDEILAGAGFEITELTTGYLPGLRPMTYTYQGAARPR